VFCRSAALRDQQQGSCKDSHDLAHGVKRDLCMQQSATSSSKRSC
jgi:hypothetical protein